MHDCGHSPCSHTFEHYYNWEERAEKFLITQVDSRFKEDYSPGSAAEHEVFSAAIFLRHFSHSAVALGVNTILATRMITGCTYRVPTNENEEIENSLIEMINGPAIDLDKLDYIIRDTWASGVDNVSIDTRRLLNAYVLVRWKHGGAKRIVPGFRKSALSVIENVVDARNYLYEWIYSHHTVVYFSGILERAIEKLTELVDPARPKALIEALFSKEVFEREVRVGNLEIFLPCDGDVLHYLKKYKDRIPEVDELLNRTPRLIPLWKTRAEFNLVFEKRTPRQRSETRINMLDILRKVEPGITENDVWVVKVAPKTLAISEGMIWVVFDQEHVEPFLSPAIRREKITSGPERDEVPYYYVFVARRLENKKKDLIAEIKSKSAKYRHT